MLKHFVFLVVIFITIQLSNAQSTAKSASSKPPVYKECEQPIHPLDYLAFRNQWTGDITDARKLNRVNDFFAGSCLYSAQIADLLSLLDFDHSRLEMAKIAWNHVFDPESFLYVCGVFEAEHYCKELKAFMDDHPVHQSSTMQNHCRFPMVEQDFEDAKNALQKQPFDDDKLKLAKQIVQFSCSTSKQIAGLMKVMAFESNRLDLAKFAFRFVYDPGNYYKVNESFNHSTTIDELNEAIYGN